MLSLAATGVLMMAYAQAPQPRRKRSAAKERAAEEGQTAQQPDAAQEQERDAHPQTLSLSLARKIMESTNTAGTVLEVDAAHSKLSVYDLPFFQEQAQPERDRYLIELMVGAGRGLLNSFTDLLNADDLWEGLARTERITAQKLANSPYPFRLRMELAELITQHIPEVLRFLGYRPPPSSEHWAVVMQHSVQRLLTVSQDDVAFAGNSATARQELAFFKRRLEALVKAAEENLREDNKNDAPRSSVLLHSLRTVVTAARNRAIPAALAAGAGAAVTGIAGGPAGMGIAFLSGGAASLLASATEAAATAWLADQGHGDTPAMSTSLAISTDLGALDDCIDLMRSATSATIENIRFIIRRGIFQTLQDAAGSAVPVRDFLWEWSKIMLSLLDSEEFSVDQAHLIVDEARKPFARMPNH